MKGAPEQRQPAHAIAVVSSHVARGAVGNRAAVFALETLGHPVIAVPTVLLPWHPGHGAATRIVPEADAFAAMMTDLSGGRFAGEIGAVLSGYLGAKTQVFSIADAVASLRARNRGLVYTCDPVIGDEHGLYVPEDLAAAIGDKLVPSADLATPNRFELSFLAGRPLADNAALIEAARALGPPRVLVTSAFADAPGKTGNLLVTRDGAMLAEHAALDRVPNGTGDLTAALFTAYLIDGLGDGQALAQATASVHDVLSRTVSVGADELALAANGPLLKAPDSKLAVRYLSLGATAEPPAFVGK